MREELLARLTEALREDAAPDGGPSSNAVLGSHIERGDIWVRVARHRWRDAFVVCKERLRFDYFCFLSGIDWMKSREAATRYEQVWDPDTDAAGDTEQSEDDMFDSGVAGSETRFQVFARLYSTRNHYGITLKADLDADAPSIESVATVYRGADWHERETWEMFGFDFPGHPGLRHLYLPSGFEGHPLRKDFPLLSREVKPWPGLVDVEPMPETADASAEEG